MLVQEFFKEFQTPSVKEDLKEPKRVYGSDGFQNTYQHMIKHQEFMPELLDQVSAGLENMDILKGCQAGHFCGSMIGQVGVCGSGRALIDFFVRVAALCCEYLSKAGEELGVEAPEDDQLEALDMEMMFQKYPDQTRAYRGCDTLALAVMEAITRDGDTRRYLREKNLYRSLEYLEGYIGNIYYVTRVHEACSVLSLTVLAPSKGIGFTAEVNDLWNNFHLMTLLEAELFRAGLDQKYGLVNYEFDEESYQIATGLAYPQKMSSVYCHQQYYTYLAMQKDGAYQTLLTGEDGRQQVDANALIWGEMPPDWIPRFDGQSVILMDTVGMFANRSWDVNFISKCHGSLNPYFRITGELSPKEAAALLEKIKNRR